MGFGILFIGYFLLLNFAYSAFTDAIAGAIMLYGLYKLSGINRGFRYASLAAGGFTALGVAKLLCEVLELFSLIPHSELLVSVLAIIKCVAVGGVTVLTLLGMKEVSAEVGLSELSEKCLRTSILALPVYVLSLTLEVLGLFSLTEFTALVVISVISIVLSLTLEVIVLIRIYACYMRICMPEDVKMEVEDKPSRFGFVNAFRRHEEERQKEYAEYKLEKMRRSAEKKKNNGNKNERKTKK